MICNTMLTFQLNDERKNQKNITWDKESTKKKEMTKLKGGKLENRLTHPKRILKKKSKYIISW